MRATSAYFPKLVADGDRAGSIRSL
jgi:hypothetical protein